MTRPFFTPRERLAALRALSAALAAVVGLAALLLFAALISHNSDDPSGLNATDLGPRNWLGSAGAQLSVDLFSWLGVAAYMCVAVLTAWTFWLCGRLRPRDMASRIAAAPAALLGASAFASAHGGEIYPGIGLGGYIGDLSVRLLVDLIWIEPERLRLVIATLVLAPIALWLGLLATGWSLRGFARQIGRMVRTLVGAERAAATAPRRVEPETSDAPRREEPAFRRRRRPMRRRAPDAAAAEPELEDPPIAAPPPAPESRRQEPRFRPEPTWRPRPQPQDPASEPKDARPATDAAWSRMRPRRRRDAELDVDAERRDGAGLRDAPEAAQPFGLIRRLKLATPDRQSGSTIETAPQNDAAPSDDGARRFDLKERLRKVRRTIDRAAGETRREIKRDAEPEFERFGVAAPAPKLGPASLSVIESAARADAPPPPLALGSQESAEPPFDSFSSPIAPPAPRRARRAQDPFEDDPFPPAIAAADPSEIGPDEAFGAGAPRLAPPAPETRSDQQWRIEGARSRARREWTIGPSRPGYAPPPVGLLDRGPRAEADPDLERRLAHAAERLQRVINEYGVRGDVIDVNPGPVVSQFELEPGPGVKVARVVGLADDIARAMSAVSARVAPIPGKNVIGVELPNDTRETVRLRALLEDRAFLGHEGALPLALGCDLAGAPTIVDLAEAPHLLIAGATGSGKSVAVNAILLSLLLRLDPTELRLILIDPKRLELSVYNKTPHLLAPVVVDAKTAVSALKWAIREMERRYTLMSQIGVRGIDGYNARAERLRRTGGVFEIDAEAGADAEADGETIRLAPDPMARIVIVIDEMADLMMVSGKEIEQCVLRLAQMGRASGIHLIAATQRPSVDVITGLIKSNFPARISLQTASAADSKTILDRPGAERLLGKGDMLLAPGGARLERLHGAFVSDAEVAAVAEHLRAMGPAEDQISFRSGEDGSAVGAEFEDADADGEDALYLRARRIVLDEQRASASFLQRRFQIGYPRASRLIEQMERDGVVSPLTPAGKREVLAANE